MAGEPVDDLFIACSRHVQGTIGWAGRSAVPQTMTNSWPSSDSFHLWLGDLFGTCSRPVHVLFRLQRPFLVCREGRRARPAESRVPGWKSSSEPVHCLFGTCSSPVRGPLRCAKRGLFPVEGGPRGSKRRDMGLDRDGGPPSSIRDCGIQEAEVKELVRSALLTVLLPAR
jgi:hypothetical protein